MDSVPEPYGSRVSGEIRVPSVFEKKYLLLPDQAVLFGTV